MVSCFTGGVYPSCKQEINNLSFAAVIAASSKMKPVLGTQGIAFDWSEVEKSKKFMQTKGKHVYLNT